MTKLQKRVEQRQSLWIEAMIQNGGNATQAAVAAGYKPGAGAHRAGQRMSRNVTVATKLEERRKEVLEAATAKTGLTAEEVIASLARDIRFDPAKMYREDGTLKPIVEMDEDTRRALRGVEVDELYEGRGEDRVKVGHTAKVKFPEVTSAREQGMKHFGLYDADNRQKPATTIVHVPGTPAPKFKPLSARDAA